MHRNDSENRSCDLGSTDIVHSADAPMTAPAGKLLFQEDILGHGGAAKGPGAKAVSLASALRFKWLILAVSVATAAPAIVSIWMLVVPEYQARAEVRVRPIIPRLVFSTEDNGLIPLYQSFMNTQVSIMRSPTVLQRVLDQQDVRQTRWYRAPPRSWLRQPDSPMERLRDQLSATPRNRTEIVDVAFTARSPKDAAVVANAVLDQYIRLTSERSDETKDQLHRRLTEQYKSLQNEIAGREKVLARLQKELGTGAPEELVARRRVRLDETEARLNQTLGEISTLELHREELRKVRRSTDISRQQMERLRYIRSISGMSEDTKRLLRTQLEKEHDALEAQLSEVQETLAKLGEGPEGGDPNDLDSQVGLQTDEMKARMAILERETEAIEWRQKELARLVEESPEDKEAPTTQPWAHSRYNTDLEWRRLDVAVRTARARAETMGKRLKDSHPTMVEMVGELELAEKLLRARETQLDQQWQSEPGVALAGRSPNTDDQPGRQPQMQDSAGTGPDYEAELKSVELQLVLLAHQRKLLNAQVDKERSEFEEVFNNSQLLDKEAQAINHKQQLFSAVRERLDHKEMERNVPGSIEVLTRAFVPSKPAKDRRAVFTVMALVLALGAGTGVAYLMANNKQAMYAAEDLPNPLRAPFLGQVPLIRKPKHAVLEEDPLVAESIRMVRTALFSRINGRCSTILISSADTGAGKSTVAAMLARSLAECGKRVLLIDADLRRRSLSERFGLADEPGFAESLTGSTPDDRAIFETDTPRLSIMPAGIPGDGGAIEATANGAFVACLDRLRPSYDVILLDACPILPVADARILSRQVDGTVLVVRQDRCRRNDVIDALAYLGSSGGKLLGTVFIGSAGRGNYQSSYHNYPYYGARK
ncbi:MAG: polysaccharide biosynthesis tyrosine autokinase [Phycisphaerae bacterium]